MLRHAIKVIVYYCRENWESSTVLLLMRTFFSVRKKEPSQSRDCLDWLLQLMGLIKNFVTGRESVNNDRLSEVYCFNTFIYMYMMMMMMMMMMILGEYSGESRTFLQR